ncbi:MAG: aldo/keto reductase [Candidatus Hydrogenedentes bacterium]|nr:aldo/keto reductase [Candidatus Hydrogenedentota bacterium]
MKYVYLGRTGIQVSRVCLGTMTFGNEADEATSNAIMDRAFEQGVNFFDTADIYNRGRTEEIVGQWLRDRRDDIVLASKVHFPTSKAINDRGSSRRHILRGVETSLKRLETDRLDLLYLHHWDEHTDIRHSLDAVDLLIRQGKVLHGAVSNFAAWQTMHALAVAEREHFAPIVAIQPMYNLVKRQAEVEILPMAQAHDLAVCPYSPMGAGLLTGKYQRREAGRIDVNPMYKERYKDPQYMETSTRFVEYAREHEWSPAALSVAWVAHHPAVTSAIVGARSVAQLDEALESETIELTGAQRNEIDDLSVAPPRATDREDPSFVPPAK